MKQNNCNIKDEEKKYYYVVCLILLLVFVAIRTDYINQDRDFWHDEAFQFLYSKEPLMFIIDANDVHPPLFNVISKLITDIFSTPQTLRYIMLLFSTIGFVGLIITITKIYNIRTASFVGFLVALSPTMIHYSTEFRNYALLLMLLPFQFYFFMTYQQKKHSIYFIIISTVMFYTHYFFALILFAETIYIFYLYYKNSKSKMYFLQLLVSILILSIPNIYHLIKTTTRYESFWFKQITFKSLWSSFNYFFSPPFSDFSLLYIFFMGFIIFLIIKFKLYKQQDVILFLILSIIPVLTLWCFSLYKPIYHHRYFLMSAVAFMILTAIVMEKIKQVCMNKTHYFVISVFMFISIMNLTNISYDHEVQNAYTKTLKDAKLNNIENINIVHTSTFSQSPFKFYSYKLDNIDNYLYNNLSEKRLFTAGGSVIKKYEIINQSQLSKLEQDTVYFVDNNKKYEILVYQENGIFVTKNK